MIKMKIRESSINFSKKKGHRCERKIESPGEKNR